MSKGPLPFLLGSPHEAEILNMRKEGVPFSAIAERLGLPVKQIRSLCGHAVRVGNFKLEPPPEVIAKEEGVAALPHKPTPREIAESHMAWIHSQMTAAIKAGASPRDISSLSGQYTAAVRLVAQLSGALDVTASQILKTVDFQRILNIFAEILGDDLPRWELLVKKLEILTGDVK